MKAEDIMINDLVKSQGKVERVYGIYENRIYTFNGNDRSAEKFEPIPLTPEILEANGFKLDKKYRTLFGGVVYEAHIGDTYILIQKCKDWGQDPKKYINILASLSGYHILYPEYVHELQHALRLCGLNDIADNFKVE